MMDELHGPPDSMAKLLPPPTDTGVDDEHLTGNFANYMSRIVNRMNLRLLELLRPYNLCHVDVSTDYGKKVAEAFKAEDFPYTAIIDKTGSVIIFAKAGKMANEEWQGVLKKFREGDRASAITTSRPTERTSFKISQDSYQSASPAIQSPNYCPSCQRRSM